MSKPRRTRATKTSGSVEELQTVSDVEESLTQLKNDVANMQTKYQEFDNNLKSQNEKTSELKNLIGKTASQEKVVDVLSLQSKYNELFYNVKILNEKLASSTSTNSASDEPSQKQDETPELLKSLKNDVGSFVTYGKLFFGIGVAALLLYIISTIIGLAASVRTAAG